LLPSDVANEALRKLFKQRLVVDLPVLFETLQTHSRMSVFRRLSALDYLSSYSHAGSYYTLADIAQFDESGLWQHQGVLFSRYGTLKQTAKQWVESSSAGQTQEQLRAWLRVRVHNALLDLFATHQIGRQPIGGCYVYLSIQADRAAQQIVRRQALLEGEAQGAAEAFSPALLIEVLLEVIHGAKLIADAKTVTQRLVARGTRVTLDVVQAIFRRYGLEKKTARSALPRSRR